MDTRMSTEQEDTRAKVLRVSNAVENAPYVVRTAKVIDVSVAASCGKKVPRRAKPNFAKMSAGRKTCVSARKSSIGR